MTTFLFNEIIFGPVFSRRLGISLGINLLPSGEKLCNFNCIYCECGFTGSVRNCIGKLPSRAEVKDALKVRLTEISMRVEELDMITFAGNGEPSLHPDFPGIIEDTIELRNSNFASAGIAVLSNATTINKESIFKALTKVDYSILKLDSGSAEHIRIINHPQSEFNIDELTNNLKKFQGKLTIQTLFLKGMYEGREVNNTTEDSIIPWLKILEQVKPEMVMVYTFSRSTPVTGLEKIGLDELKEIAGRVEKMGIKVQVSG